ncbi:Fanconi anemia group G protein isoform X2 [Acanthopagrus latus]|uniref:Fanconi anemia group G protein isoform X2 n=1 Tax=Acanthopagrus latus TaxID=8177 RepID=UPI00187D0C26|nr:Fanconi anemia group G protein isoform X2 [Acanthopagrus latus]
MSIKTYQPLSLCDRWTQENNELVNKWKQEGGAEAVSHNHNQTHLRWCSSEFHKLSRKIQGIPPLVDHAQLELTVVYNACLCSVALSQFSEADLLLSQATERVVTVIQMTGDDPISSDPPAFWKTLLKSMGNTTFTSSVQHLLCLQWAVWLAKCQLKTIQEFQDELFSLFETLSTEFGDDERSSERGKSSDIPMLVMDPRRLIELLQTCTFIAQGAERLSEGQSSEALSGLQKASSLSAPRTLLAYTHHLSGLCLASMSCPQMALQCYRMALETDSWCVCALYQSILIYRELENTQAEIQALRLLHSTLLLPSATEPPLAGTPLLSPSVLLCSQSLNRMLSVPSALSVLHSLAQKCVLHGRVSEGVEYYLDLLAALHSDDQHGSPSQVHAKDPPLPRLPELYLEAGAALLTARRPADCVALCDEVIGTTLELLPEKLVLEEPEEKFEVETRTVGAEGEDRMKMLLWTGAAYLLQGHCHTHLRDWKQAVTHYTRCINLLVKVHFKKKGFQPQIPSADMVGKQGTDLCILQRLKGLSLAGRGISFSQTGQLREALRDLHLSLQAVPDCVGAGLWCGEVLWRLGRRQEAAACWEKTWSFPAQSSVESLRLYLQEPQSGPLLDSTELRHRIHELGSTLSA